MITSKEQKAKQIHILYRKLKRLISRAYTLKAKLEESVKNDPDCKKDLAKMGLIICRIYGMQGELQRLRLRIYLVMMTPVPKFALGGCVREAGSLKLAVVEGNYKAPIECVHQYKEVRANEMRCIHCGKLKFDCAGSKYEDVKFSMDVNKTIFTFNPNSDNQL